MADYFCLGCGGSLGYDGARCSIPGCPNSDVKGVLVTHPVELSCLICGKAWMKVYLDGRFFTSCCANQACENYDLEGMRYLERLGLR